MPQSMTGTRLSPQDVWDLRLPVVRFPPEPDEPVEVLISEEEWAKQRQLPPGPLCRRCLVRRWGFHQARRSCPTCRWSLCPWCALIDGKEHVINDHQKPVQRLHWASGKSPLSPRSQRNPHE